MEPQDRPDPTSDPELLGRIARLARLELDPSRRPALEQQFARILAAFEKLSQVDVEGVEPMRGAPPGAEVVRPDEPRPSLDRESLLERAPEPVEGFYSVPKTIAPAHETPHGTGHDE